jgi:hypothetical protein
VGKFDMFESLNFDNPDGFGFEIDFLPHPYVKNTIKKILSLFL